MCAVSQPSASIRRSTSSARAAECPGTTGRAVRRCGRASSARTPRNGRCRQSAGRRRLSTRSATHERMQQKDRLAGAEMDRVRANPSCWPTLKVIPAVPQAWSDYGLSPVIVSTINVNGIRAAVKERSPRIWACCRGWRRRRADVVCLQETRADDEQLGRRAGARRWPTAGTWRPPIHTSRAATVLRCSAATRHPSRDRIWTPTSSPLHGRYLEVDTAGLTVASVYFPTGEAEHRPSAREGALHGGASRARMEVLRRERPRRRRVRRLEHRAHRERHQGLEGNGRRPDSCRPNGSGSPTCWRRAGSTWCGCCIPMSRGPTAGGHGGAGRSTTTRAGASTISWPPRPGRAGSAPHGSSAPRPTRCGGPTTRR